MVVPCIVTSNELLMWATTIIIIKERNVKTFEKSKCLWAPAAARGGHSRHYHPSNDFK